MALGFRGLIIGIGARNQLRFSCLETMIIFQRGMW